MTTYPHVEQHRFDFCPWLFWNEASQAEQQAQLAWQAALSHNDSISIGQHCFVSPLAGVYPTQLELGDHSYIAAHAYVTDQVRLGQHCTINPFAVVRGNVQLGDGVRVGAHASVLGFNHSFDIDRPVYQQPLTAKGIMIGDDVWIGSSVIILDGVTIGDHCVIGAGAVVTRDVPPYSVAAGNPARVIRNRLDSTSHPPRSTKLTQQLSDFGQRVREQWPDVLQRCIEYKDDGVQYRNYPGAAPTIRAWCDAVEIAACFDSAPPQTERTVLIKRLQSFQDSRTGLLPDPSTPPDPATYTPALLSDHLARYHILAVGYALELLGSTFAHPIHVVEVLSVERLYAHLEQLPWETNAWGCGDWIDCYATGLYFNSKYFGSSKTVEPLAGWLLSHANGLSGMWGQPTLLGRWLQPVNGFYRLTRGSYAQFGIPLPYPEATIDTVLAHSRDRAFFRDDRGNACNVLDVIHPLWLCGLQTDYRRADVQIWAARQIERVIGKWHDGAGFSFALEPGLGPAHVPALMGTEMWLSILYLLAEVCGASDRLGYRPTGVHRLQPAWCLNEQWQWAG